MPIRPRSRNSFSGFCAEDPGNMDNAKYLANSHVRTGSVRRYSIRYLNRKIARQKLESKA